jgi:hypothetical protein
VLPGGGNDAADHPQGFSVERGLRFTIVRMALYHDQPRIHLVCWCPPVALAGRTR